MELNATNVETVFVECLGKEGDPLIKGVFHSAYLNTDKRAEDIASMLDQLPAEFNEGWTFLNACKRADGTQWADDHFTIEKLVLLGLSTGKVNFCMPREFWSGMPYFQVTP